MKVFQTALPVVVCLQKHRSQNFPIVLLLMWQGGLMEHSAPAILIQKSEQLLVDEPLAAVDFGDTLQVQRKEITVCGLIHCYH